jgi:hypothetical protein
MAKKLSMTMREEFAELEESMDDWMAHTEMVSDEAGDQRKNMMKAWNQMDKAYEAFKKSTKIFIRAQQTLNESDLSEGKALDMVKKGQLKKLDDDQLADVAGEIENKKWNKDNKAEVQRWVKDINAEMKKRGMSFGESPVKATFESDPGDGSRTFKQYFAEKTKTITEKSSDGHWHEAVLDDEGDGKTTKTLPKGHPDHTHNIVGAEVQTAGKKKHSHLLKG